MQHLLSSYGLVSLIVLMYMTVWFFVSLIRARNDVADVAWGLGFLLVACVSFAMGPMGMRGMLITALVMTWALRLSIHIYRRNRNKAEDSRYKIWRTEWGRWFYLRSYFQVFLLQGFLLLLISCPVIIVNTFLGTALGLLDTLGVCIWIVGFYIESTADRQLAAFIKEPSNKGHIMQSGLWAYSRHPNYFGEVTQWWGVWVIALSVPFGWLAIIGPCVITFLILKVSGIPMLEAHMQKNPAFAEYRQRVSIFFPLPPRS